MFLYLYIPIAMHLNDFLAKFLSTRFISAQTEYQYQHSLACYMSITKHRDTREMSRESIVQYCKHEMDRGLSPHTIRARAVRLATLWREAHDIHEAVDYRRHKAPRAPRKIVRAIPQPDIVRLVEHCKTIRGYLKRTNVPRGVFWSAFAAASFETALRTSDLRQLRWQPIGRWHLIQKKTKHPVSVDVGKVTLELIAELAKHSPDLFDQGWGKDWYCRGLKKLALSIGISVTPQRLRESAASEAERQQPGTAWILLGHRSPETTQKWYIDSAHAYSNLPRPRIQWKEPNCE